MDLYPARDMFFPPDLLDYLNGLCWKSIRQENLFIDTNFTVCRVVTQLYVNQSKALQGFALNLFYLFWDNSKHEQLGMLLCNGLLYLMNEFIPLNKALMHSRSDNTLDVH